MRYPNGFGCVSKLSGKRRKPFIVRGGATYTSKGAERRAIIGYYATKQEAVQALAEYSKSPTTKIGITLEQLYTEWTRTRAFTELSQETQNNYNASWNKRLSELAKERVKDIRTGQLQTVIDKAEKEGKSRSSLSKDKALMTILFDYAMQNDIVHKNYAKFVELPSDSGVSTRDAFTDVELARIEQAVPQVPFADCIMMLCYTGFRIQEFLKLTSFSYDKTAGTLTGGLKTEAGRDRVIPIHPKIAALVEQWAARGGETLICREDGSSYNVKYFREKCYTPALNAIEGVRKLSPHCCRHTFATLLHNRDIDPLDVQLLMGHSKYEQSTKYTHKNMGRLKDAVNSI